MQHLRDDFFVFFADNLMKAYMQTFTDTLGLGRRLLSLIVFFMTTILISQAHLTITNTSKYNSSTRNPTFMRVILLTDLSDHAY